jgi:hypothetical protein
LTLPHSFRYKFDSTPRNVYLGLLPKTLQKTMSNTILQHLPIGQKVGIAFSGGLDTSAALRCLMPTPPTSASPMSPITTRFRAKPWSTAQKKRA